MKSVRYLKNLLNVLTGHNPFQQELEEEQRLHIEETRNYQNLTENLRKRITDKDILLDQQKRDYNRAVDTLREQHRLQREELEQRNQELRDALSATQDMLQRVNNDLGREMMNTNMLAKTRNALNDLCQAMASEDVETMKRVVEYLEWCNPLSRIAQYHLRVLAQTKIFVLKFGIYLVYQNGNSIPFERGLEKDLASDVNGIGVVYGGHSFLVALEDLGEWPLVNDYEKCPEESSFYKTECEGLQDWDFVSATNHIKEIGTDIPLPEGWYIPTLAVLEVMCFLKEKINEAIKFAGGKPMPDGRHWSSTETSRYYARYVYFTSGLTGNNGKYTSYVIRPVTAFY